MINSGPVGVITQEDDATADAIIAELNARNVPVVRLDPGAIGVGLAMTLMFDEKALAGTAVTDTRLLDLADVRSMLWRRPSIARYERLAEQDARFARAQNVQGVNGVLENLPGCLQVNKPGANRAAESKPSQLALAAELNLGIPDTLITNDLAQARAFIAEREAVIYKPLDATSYERDGEPVTIWTAEVTAAEIDESVEVAMHLFQERVPKVADWRITVVGDAVFCVEINAPRGLLDWRQDYSRLTYKVITPPEELAKQLRAFLDRFGLVFGCFDFGITADGEPVFFELNPNGQWAWLQAATGLPIAAAFADVLAKGMPS